MCKVIRLFHVSVFLLAGPIAYQAAIAQAELAGTVTQTRDGAVRVRYEADNGIAAAIGDAVRFTMTMDGFELDAGAGEVSESSEGHVWVAVSDSRVQVGMLAVIQATGTDEPSRNPATPGSVTGAAAAGVGATTTSSDSKESELRFQLDEYRRRLRDRSISGQEREAILQKLSRESPIESQSLDTEELAEEVYTLGMAYLYGDAYQGIEEDWRKGITYIFLAVERDNPAALTKMGSFQRYGQYGWEQDVMLAIRFYQSATDKGYAPAFARLAELYATGNTVPYSESETELLMSQMASHIDAAGTKELRIQVYVFAGLHWSGYPGYESRARSYYTKACRLGDSFGCESARLL